MYSEKTLRQDVDAGGFVGRDHQFAARIGLQFVDGILRAAAQVQHLLGVFGENPAGGGQRNAAAEALEQLGAQLLLELADLRADGRLRAVTRLRGLGKALQPDDLEKRVELVEIHNMPGLAPRPSCPVKNLNRRDRNNGFPSRRSVVGKYCNRRPRVVRL